MFLALPAELWELLLKQEIQPTHYEYATSKET